MKNAILLLFLSVQIVLFSQEKKLDSDSIGLLSASVDLKFDTLAYWNLNDFQIYRDHIEFAPYSRSGNIGLSLHSFSPTNLNSNYSIVEGYKAYLINKNKLKFYNSNKPYTALRYFNGSKKEQYFTAFHTQNITKLSNFSFQYDRITSEGFFLQQLTNHTKFNATFHLENRKKTFKTRKH